MRSEENQIGFFLSLAQEASLWQAINLRILAFRIDGPWCNLHTRLTLHSSPPDTPSPLITDHVGVWHQNLPIENLPEIIHCISKGYFQIAGERITYLQNQYEEDRKTEPYNRPRVYFTDTLDGTSSHIKWSRSYLSMYGSPMGELMPHTSVERSEIDNELRMLDTPYDGIDSIAKLVFGPDYTGDQSRASTFQCYALYETNLIKESCKFEREFLNFTIFAQSEAIIKKCSLGILSQSISDHHSGVIELAQEKWQESQGGFIYKDRVNVPNATSVTLMLRVWKYSVDRITLHDFRDEGVNPKIQAYKLIDDDLEYLKTSLNPSTDSDASRFEHAVGRLFHCLGFQTDLFIKDKKLSKTVDVIAFEQSTRTTLAIECTTGSIDNNDKLGKLLIRQQQLTKILSEYDVIGVMIASIERASIPPANLDKAGEISLAVITQEDIDLLLEMAIEAKSVYEAIEFVKSRIPRQEHPPLKGMRMPGRFGS